MNVKKVIAQLMCSTILEGVKKDHWSILRPTIVCGSKSWVDSNASGWYECFANYRRYSHLRWFDYVQRILDWSNYRVLAWIVLGLSEGCGPLLGFVIQVWKNIINANLVFDNSGLDGNKTNSTGMFHFKINRAVLQNRKC